MLSYALRESESDAQNRNCKCDIHRGSCTLRAKEKNHKHENIFNKNFHWRQHLNVL